MPHRRSKLARPDWKTDKAESDLRDTVGETFNVYQGTMTMLSIFMGFVFAGLLQLLGSDSPVSASKQQAVGALVIANLSLLSSLLFLHYTANQVVRHWQLFFPESVQRMVGAMLFGVGVISMQVALIILLVEKNLVGLAFIAGGGTALVTLLNVTFGSIHRGASYVRHVDRQK
jgi:hypothetical protein